MYILISFSILTWVSDTSEWFVNGSDHSSALETADLRKTIIMWKDFPRPN